MWNWICYSQIHEQIHCGGDLKEFDTFPFLILPFPSVFLWNKCLKVWKSGPHRSLPIWPSKLEGFNVMMKNSWLLPEGSSHQSFNPKCWIHAVICLARNTSLISWYHILIMCRADYVHAQFPALGFSVGLPVRGKKNEQQFGRKSTHVQQFCPQIPKEKCSGKCSLIVSDQNASAGSWSSNALCNRHRLIVGFLLLPTGSSYRTHSTVCSLIKRHKESPPALPGEAEPAERKAQPKLCEEFANNCRMMVFRRSQVILLHSFH